MEQGSFYSPSLSWRAYLGAHIVALIILAIISQQSFPSNHPDFQVAGLPFFIMAVPMPTFPAVDEQITYLKKGSAEIIRESDLRAKLEKSFSTGKPLRRETRHGPDRSRLCTSDTR